MKIIVLLNLLLGCLANRKYLRIFRGQNADPGEFPHMLSVQEEFFNPIHICGASIVCERWALTAAHCISLSQSAISNGHINVIAGAWDLTNPSKYQQKVRVDGGVIHPEYTGGGYEAAPHDIGLLHLEEPLVWNDWIKPVILAPTITHTQKYAMFSGWGKISKYPDDVYPNILQRANMRIITIDQCYYTSLKLGIHNNFNFDTDICTTSHTGQVCERDSGSPLGIWDGDNFIQLGVAVWTIGNCGFKGAPSVFQRVTPYINWIHHTIGDCNPRL